jgi:hypothetical protein
MVVLDFLKEHHQPNNRLVNRRFYLMKHLLFALLAVCVLAACSTTPTPDGSSGIYGQVSIGPMCPVVKIDEPCPDKPYQATLSVLTTSGDLVTRFTTDTDGKFKVSLVPGEYILRPETPENMALPIAQEQPFNVISGQFTELNVSYDSGIR